MSGGLSISKQGRQDKLPVAHKELKGKGDRAKLRHDTGEELAAVLSNIWVSPRRLLALWSCPLQAKTAPWGWCSASAGPLRSTYFPSSLAQAARGQGVPPVLP